MEIERKRGNREEKRGERESQLKIKWGEIKKREISKKRDITRKHKI